MKFYSEITKKFYNEAKICREEEEAYLAEQAKKTAEEEARRAARKERAGEIEDLLRSRDELNKTINEKIRQFTDDYGSYHYSFHKDDGDVTSRSIFDILDNLFFKV